MSTLLNDTKDAAQSTMETAKEGTMHAVSNARSTLLDGIHAVSGVVSILRGLQVSDALGWIGLSRRRGPFETIALFGAGVAVGTGIGMLFAPSSGADLRRSIFGKLQGVEKDAERAVGKAGTDVKERVKDIEHKIENKAEDLAGKAKGALSNAENKADDYANKAKSAIMNTERKAEDFAGKAKDTVKDVAANVKDTAKDAAANVKDTAKDFAANVDHKADDYAKGKDTKTDYPGGNNTRAHSH